MQLGFLLTNILFKIFTSSFWMMLTWSCFSCYLFVCFWGQELGVQFLDEHMWKKSSFHVLILVVEFDIEIIQTFFVGKILIWKKHLMGAEYLDDLLLGWALMICFKRSVLFMKIVKCIGVKHSIIFSHYLKSIEQRRKSLLSLVRVCQF